MADLSNASASFAKRVDESERIVSSVETLWQTAPIKSEIRKQIGVAQLNALYEMAFLSLFGYWENFIEECLTRMLSGQGCTSYQPTVLVAPKPSSLSKARQRVLNGQNYLLWYDAKKAADRTANLIQGSPLEAMLRGNQSQIKLYAAVRHAIAHQSEDSRISFVNATLRLTGVAHGSPGDFLRAQDHTDPLNPVRWIRKISTDMRGYALTATT